jgi:signal transduction histidine kinase
LDRVGFHEALRKYVDSYVNRTGIQTQLQITTGIESLLPHMETTFYRIVQEGLSNIHRHSGSRTAEILLSREGSYVVLEIKDYGTGMPLERLMLCQDQDAVIGVGVAGMRERVSEFGGEFNLYSDHTGTRLIARLPMGERA